MSTSTPHISALYRHLTECIESRHSAPMARKQREQVDEVRRFLPLPASAMHIIVALADGEKHGYAIMREVEEVSAGAVTMGPGTLYGSIKRMIDQGLLEETDERPDPALDDQRRRYYRLTQLGHRVGAAEQDRLRQLVSAAQARRLGLGLGGAT
jgi:DNA-binding PadR family transcriptional regulator